MAVTIIRTHVRNPDMSDTRMRVLCRITGPASYAAGGEAIEAKHVGLGKLEALIPSSGLAGNATTGAIPWFYNPTTGKIVFLVAADFSEQTGAANLSTYRFDVEAVGT